VEPLSPLAVFRPILRSLDVGVGQDAKSCENIL
jgi:hypothetical protein